MTSRIEWVRESCRMLSGITAEFEGSQPFVGLTIGTGIHVEPKTVALLLALKAGGATVIATGNLNSTQPSAVTYLQEHGVTVGQIHEVVSVARAGRESDTRPRSDRLSAGIRDEHKLTLDDIDKLVLLRVRMSGRRLAARQTFGKEFRAASPIAVNFARGRRVVRDPSRM